MNIKSTVLALSLLSVSALADKPYYLKGDINFSSTEKDQHMRVLPKIEEVFETCLKDKITTHRNNFKKYGFSTFYGDQSKYAKANRSEKIKMIKQAALSNRSVKYPANTNFASFIDLKIMKPTSCIGLTLYCMEEAFTDRQVNSGSTWRKIKSFVAAKNDSTGTSLQYALQQLGWTVAYFNTNPSLNKQRDAFEYSPQANYRQSQRGDHHAHYVEIRKQGRYFDFLMDDTTSLVGFGHTMPVSFENVGMFIGVAHKGYHVFPGFKGTVVEGHSSMPLNAWNTIEAQVFDPSDKNKAPRGEFHSGSIAIPPHYKLMSLQEERRQGITRQQKRSQKQTKSTQRRGLFGNLFNRN